MRYDTSLETVKVQFRKVVEKDSPVDVCLNCYDAKMGDVEHPPYSNDTYHCAICSMRLDDTE